MSDSINQERLEAEMDLYRQAQPMIPLAIEPDIILQMMKLIAIGTTHPAIPEMRRNVGINTIRMLQKAFPPDMTELHKLFGALNKELGIGLEST